MVQSEVTTEEPVAARRRARWATVPILIALLAFGVRAWQPGPTTQTTDEALWLMRTGFFTKALVEAQPADMTTSWAPFVRELENQGVIGPTATLPASTMPGVTTMWAGTVGRGLTNLGAALGVNDNSAPIMASAQTLRAGRLVVAAWCVIAVGVLVALLAWLVGRRAAAVTGVLLAVEPFVVGHSSLLHTDAMVAMFGTVGAAALAVALWGHRPAPEAEERTGAPPRDRARRWLLVLTGVAAALCVLTKLNGAFVVGPPLVIALLIDAFARWRRRDRAGLWAALRPTVLSGALVVGTIIVTMLVVWPALWADPGGQLDAIGRTGDIMRIGDSQFFMGEATRDPDVRFYFVTTVFRTSPWLLVGVLAGAAIVVVSFVRRWPDRPDLRVLTTLVGGSIVYLLVLMSVGKKFDRYALPFWPWMALITAIGGVMVYDRVRARLPSTSQRVRFAVVAVAVALLALVPLSYAPYASAYVDPLVGGQGAASQRISLGWGEGIERLGQVIAEREEGRCDDLTLVGTTLAMQVALPCRPMDSGSGDRPDYVVRYVRDEQLGTAPRVPFGYELLRTVTIGGYPYARIWGLPA